MKAEGEQLARCITHGFWDNCHCFGSLVKRRWHSQYFPSSADSRMRIMRSCFLRGFVAAFVAVYSQEGQDHCQVMFVWCWCLVRCWISLVWTTLLLVHVGAFFAWAEHAPQSKGQQRDVAQRLSVFCSWWLEPRFAGGDRLGQV